MVKGGDNSVQEYGSEAGNGAFKAAAAALHGFLDARAEHNWAASCAYLAASVVESFQSIAAERQSGSIKGEGCAATLAALAGQVPSATLREAAVADAGALRRDGDQAFLIYRGVHGVVFAIQVIQEGGTWKVAALNGVPLS